MIWPRSVTSTHNIRGSLLLLRSQNDRDNYGKLCNEFVYDFWLSRLMCWNQNSPKVWLKNWPLKSFREQKGLKKNLLTSQFSYVKLYDVSETQQTIRYWSNRFLLLFLTIGRTTQRNKNNSKYKMYNEFDLN